MIKAVSFDIWITLITGNPEFRREKCELIRKFFDLSTSDEQILNAFKRTDKLLDAIQENYCLQPDYLTSWGIVLYEIGLKETNFDQINLFLESYNQLFLNYPPILQPDVEYLFEQLNCIADLRLYLLGNTILVVGEILDKFIKTTVLKDVPAFYSDSCFPKPDPRAFGKLKPKPEIHVGDNPVTDGGCQNAGIEFFQVRSNGKSLIDFWQYLKLQL